LSYQSELETARAALKGLALGSMSCGFSSSEVPCEFGVQSKAKVLRLVDVVDRV